ncbi:MAG: c-type cytochrome [Myxococcales bacterium]|nr:c-type cytochrome [Myxococcales bacterium]
MSEPTIKPAEPQRDTTGAPLLSHDYDGIQEFDNPLPGWWTAILVLSVIHSVAYFIWFHGGGPGKSETETYAAEWADYAKLKKDVAAKEAAEISEATLAAASKDQAVLARGKEVFTINCVSCHGPAGAGLVGPNLTDMSQIHGAQRLDIYKTIRDGVIDKGMVAWGTMLTHEQVVDVTAYTATLRGQNVAGKAAEGQAVSPYAIP